MISSAVLIPEEPQAHVDTGRQSPPPKRRLSSTSISSASSKRPRLDLTSSNPAPGSLSPPSNAAASPKTRNDGQAMSPPRQSDMRRRQSSQNLEQDKSRNRRLFGSLLGALSQPSRPAKSSTASTTKAAQNSRREEIESRQRERLKRDSDEIAALARKKKQDLDRVRQVEQRRWDEQAMKSRHRHLRAAAGCLRTTTEPRLYYKPWELRNDEEELIKHQIEEAEKTIRREVDEFDAKRTPRQVEATDGKQDEHKDVDDDRPQSRSPSGDRNGNGDDGQSALPSEEKVTEPAITLNETKDDTVSDPPKQEPASKDEDHGGEELEQGQEDDVIY